MKHRVLLAVVLAVALVGSASAGTIADAKYRLFYVSGTEPLRVLSTDALPPGSNVPPNNEWQYEYEVLNKSANPLSMFYAFFNSDNVDRAQYVSAAAPADWTILKQGPYGDYFNFKIRYRTLVQDSKILTGDKLFCSANFTWTGDYVPGPQNCDVVTDGGSESGVTIEITEDIVPTVAATWGKLKSLYR